MPRVRTHSNPFHYFHRMEKVDFKPVDLEIGFGMGLFIHDYAIQNPGRNIMGVEIRPKPVKLVADKVGHIPTVYLVHGNAQICLEDMIGDQSLENVFVFHPDPWFKKSHHKRRVINQSLLKILNQKLKKNGRIYISTDVEDLWIYMEEKLLENGNFKKIEDPLFWETYYKTNWQRLSDSDGRTTHFGVFQHMLN